ncbi:hypothetical protein GCM10020358_21450 [Amorphoplanes nipponensis]
MTITKEEVERCTCAQGSITRNANNSQLVKARVAQIGVAGIIMEAQLNDEKGWGGKRKSVMQVNTVSIR